MASVTYLLCAAASLCCTVLLALASRGARSRFLFWSMLCFAGLTIANVLLVIDLLVVPEVDLLTIRQLVTLFSVLTLIWGFVWDVN